MIDERRTAHLLSSLRYEPETGALFWTKPGHLVRAGDRADRLAHRGRVIAALGTAIAAHRAAYLVMTGRLPSAVIDHINGDPSDNRWSNLREATHAENLRNRGAQRDNASGFKGVYFCDRGIRHYRAVIVLNKRKIYLGVFATPEEAHAAYCVAAEKYHGEFARVA